MKLITEYNESDVQCIVEKKEDGSKKYLIEGVFAMADSKNRNGRIYPKAILEKAVDKYVTDQVNTKRAVGELNHPEGPTVNLDKVSHLITELKFEGNNVMGKAQVLETPMGQIVKGLLEGGVQLGVSTRGMGSLEQRNGASVVKDDFFALEFLNALLCFLGCPRRVDVLVVLTNRFWRRSPVSFPTVLFASSTSILVKLDFLPGEFRD